MKTISIDIYGFCLTGMFLMDGTAICSSFFFFFSFLRLDIADLCFSLNYFAATESVVLLKLAHSLSSISKDDES
jgi:hypothetical protein